MAKANLSVKMKLKWWAKPIVFALCILGQNRLIGKWMFDFKISAE